MSVAKKKILALPEGDIFLKRDIEILENHFEIRTAPVLAAGDRLQASLKSLRAPCGQI